MERQLSFLHANPELLCERQERGHIDSAQHTLTGWAFDYAVGNDECISTGTFRWVTLIVTKQNPRAASNPAHLQHPSCIGEATRCFHARVNGAPWITVHQGRSQSRSLAVKVVPPVGNCGQKDRDRWPVIRGAYQLIHKAAGHDREHSHVA